VAQVRWSVQATEDFNAVYRSIARTAPRAAELFAERILAAANQLEAFPLSGREVPERASRDFREVIIGNYRLIYQLTSPDELLVLTVHHGARRLPELN
jgi:addiction module RelE/StbE family toxin